MLRCAAHCHGCHSSPHLIEVQVQHSQPLQSCVTHKLLQSHQTHARRQQPMRSVLERVGKALVGGRPYRFELVPAR